MTINAAPEKSIVVNGEPSTTRADTLLALIAEKGYGSQRVATAVNGSFVAEKERGRTPIRDDDRIEILSARQGG